MHCNMLSVLHCLINVIVHANVNGSLKRKVIIQNNQALKLIHSECCSITECNSSKISYSFTTYTGKHD